MTDDEKREFLKQVDEIRKEVEEANIRELIEAGWAIPTRLIQELRTDEAYNGDAHFEANYNALTANEQHAVNHMFQQVCGWSLATLIAWAKHKGPDEFEADISRRPGQADWDKQHYQRMIATTDFEADITAMSADIEAENRGT
jgi:hypothetical protein